MFTWEYSHQEVIRKYSARNGLSSLETNPDDVTRPRRNVSYQGCCDFPSAACGPEGQLVAVSTLLSGGKRVRTQHLIPFENANEL